MTVSRVLNNKSEISDATRQKILDTMNDLGYRPSRIARSLATDETFLLGVIVPSISSEYFTEVVRGTEDAAWKRNYKTLLCNTEGDWNREEGMYRFLDEIQADGIVVCAPRLSRERLIPLLERAVAVVVNGPPISPKLAGIIEMDEIYAMGEAVNHLLNIGRSRLAYLGGPPDARAARERHRGFVKALQAAGHEKDPDLCITCYPANLPGGYIAIKDLLANHPEIDGCVCFNDLIAAGALRACADLGIRVPDDVAITGYDDILLASMIHPSLTTLSYPKQDIGALAIQVLLERIHGERDHNPFVIKPSLIIRESAPQKGGEAAQGSTNHPLHTHFPT